MGNCCIAAGFCCHGSAAMLSDEELRLIIELCNNDATDNHEKIFGGNGHSYDIWLENNKRYSLRCCVHECLESVANVINMLVDKARLDGKRYVIRVRK